MLCPICNSKTKIYNSRSTHGKTQTWRRHRCLSCAALFTTREKLDLDGIININDDQNTAPYSRERLLLSIIRASNMLDLPNGMISELTDTIEGTLRNRQFFKKQLQDKKLICEAAITVLTRYNKNLALQYLNYVYSNQPPLDQVNKILNEDN